MNGWKNVETWTCYNWLTNEEPSYNYWTEAAAAALAEADGNKERAAGVLADKIRAEILDGEPLANDMYSDLLDIAIYNIDCYEIAAAFLE